MSNGEVVVRIGYMRGMQQRIKKIETWVVRQDAPSAVGLASLLQYAQQHGRTDSPAYTVADVPKLRAQGGLGSLLADDLERTA
jgi:hypothetical protein